MIAGSGLDSHTIMSTTPNASAYTARCSCGSFSLQAPNPPLLQLTCHCEQCRRASGQPSTNFAFFKRAEVQTTGATTVQPYTADSGAQTYRELCAACGQMVMDRTEGFPKIIGVVAECLQPPYVFQPRCHVWLQNKVSDPVLPEGVRAFERGMT